MSQSRNLEKCLSAATCILFDVDGTLVDSNDYHAEAWAKALRKFGHSFSTKDIRPWIGKGGDKILGELANIDDQSSAEVFAALHS